MTATAATAPGPADHVQVIVDAEKYGAPSVDGYIERRLEDGRMIVHLSDYGYHRTVSPAEIYAPRVGKAAALVSWVEGDDAYERRPVFVDADHGDGTYTVFVQGIGGGPQRVGRGAIGPRTRRA